MSGVPEHLKVHRELEYLRAVGSVPKKKGKKMSAGEKKAAAKARKRIKDRYEKLQEVNWDE